MASATVYNSLMVKTLQKVHRELGHHLLGSSQPVAEGTDPTELQQRLTKAASWAAVQPTLLSFLKSTLGASR